jgi:hypothetical protein
MKDGKGESLQVISLNNSIEKWESLDSTFAATEQQARKELAFTIVLSMRLIFRFAYITVAAVNARGVSLLPSPFFVERFRC